MAKNSSEGIHGTKGADRAGITDGRRWAPPGKRRSESRFGRLVQTTTCSDGKAGSGRIDGHVRRCAGYNGDASRRLGGWPRSELPMAARRLGASVSFDSGRGAAGNGELKPAGSMRHLGSSQRARSRVAGEETGDWSLTAHGRAVAGTPRDVGRPTIVGQHWRELAQKSAECRDRQLCNVFQENQPRRQTMQSCPDKSPAVLLCGWMTLAAMLGVAAAADEYKPDPGYKPTRNLSQFFAKVKAGRPVTVMGIGGSVTGGCGCPVGGVAAEAVPQHAHPLRLLRLRRHRPGRGSFSFPPGYPPAPSRPGLH